MESFDQYENFFHFFLNKFHGLSFQFDETVSKSISGINFNHEWLINAWLRITVETFGSVTLKDVGDMNVVDILTVLRTIDANGNRNDTI